MAPRDATGTRGGAMPGAVGNDLVRDVLAALGWLPGVVAMRNPVMRVKLPSGGHAWTGIGGEGAPDVHVEVMGAGGQWRCVWMECKAGTGKLTPAQRQWHEAARRMGRHAYVVRSVEHARAIVDSFKRGEVHVD